MDPIEPVQRRPPAIDSMLIEVTPEERERRRKELLERERERRSREEQERQREELAAMPSVVIDADLIEDAHVDDEPAEHERAAEPQAGAQSSGTHVAPGATAGEEPPASDPAGPVHIDFTV